MNIWLTSDTHFGHKKIIELAHRPVDFEDLILKRHHLKEVKENDVIIHLGDVALYKEDFFHNKFLSGFPSKTKKWLIKGNHERRTDTFYMDKGWDFVGEKIIINRFGKRILFSHIPQEKTDFWDLNIHGHLHNRSRIIGVKEEKQINGIFCLSNNHILVELEHHYSITNLQTLMERARKK